MDKLKEVLTNHSISAGGEVLTSPIDVKKAKAVRDALAKKIYENIFVSIVNKINETISQPRVRVHIVSTVLLSFVTQKSRLKLFSSGL